MMRIRPLFAPLIGLFVVLAGLPASGADRAAEIVSLEGRGEFREAQQASWSLAKVRQELFPTNFVRTGDLSRMAVLFVDRTQVRLAPNSVLQIKEAGGTRDAKTILNLNSGRSWVQSKTAPRGLVMETPSALAAIRGTDWEMAVDAEGRATLSVFSGEVELSNEHGSVVVNRGEQARAEKGKAPVKLLVTVSRERVQWVSSVTVDPERYAETRGAGRPEAAPVQAVVALVREQRLAEAYARLRAAIAGEAGGVAVAHLLLADFEAYRGELAAANAALAAAMPRFPGDERFAAGLARMALLDGESARSLELARAAAARSARSVEAWLAVGDAARLEGLAKESADAYQSAIDLAAGDARGWHGLGVVEGERENLRRAKSLLGKARELDPGRAETAAELGTVSTLAGNLEEARAAFGQALERSPDHYVAWTGLGILELRSGRLEAATQALLKASLVEPNYSRAHLYLAAAHYQAERREAAQEELRRAAETDPRDPMPHLMAGIIHLDAIEPVAAAREAREALVRLPYLKSPSAIADNQKGIANVGSALAFMGLEAWSRSSAQDSYLPFWGASHLFLADRYPGEFARRSELMQGFVTEPTAFGASNRFQSLVPSPGHHATAAAHYSRSDDNALTEAVFNANGMDSSVFPASYFVEAIGSRYTPRSNPFEATGRTFTAAAGAKPAHDLSLFVYANRLDIDSDIGRPGETGDFIHIEGASSRLDVGARYARSADEAFWLKAGATREDSTARTLSGIYLPEFALVQQSDFQIEPQASDAAFRHTRRRADGFEFTWGAETSREDFRGRLVRDSGIRFPDTVVYRDSLDERDLDKSRSVYAIARVAGAGATGEFGAVWRDYRKDRDILATFESGTVPGDEHYRRRGTDLRGGLVWRPAEGHGVRLACLRWLRPIALDSLMPVAVAGVPIDDQLVLPGGEMRQCRAQWEWTISPRAFATMHYQEARVENLYSPLIGPLNARRDITNLDRLRNRVLTPPGRPDELEDLPVYSTGLAKRFHAAYERTLGESAALRMHYEYQESENRGPFYAGLRIPYLPRHHADIGLTWSPGWRSFVTVAGAWRSVRYADEGNFVALQQGWDALVKVYVESADKRWAVEAFAYNLLKKEYSDVFGVILSWRF